MSKYNKENPLRVTTLFSGYDSQCLSLERLKKRIPGFDYELVNWCEFDKYAIQAHNALFPQWEERNLGDITRVDWSKASKCDLLTYSSPCQDFSNAGLQRGGEEGSGTRSSLLWECRKAIETLKPKYLLMENVKALVSKKFAPTFLKWLNVLEELGYTNYYEVMNARDQGCPQNRERIFVFSILGEHKPYHFPQPIPLELRLKDILEEEVDDKYVLSETAIQGFLKHNENHKAKGTGFLWIPKDVDNPGGQIASCLSARQFKCGATDNYIREFRGGNQSLTASEQLALSAQRTIPLENGDIANCLRARASLNATDNTIVEHGKDTD